MDLNELKPIFELMAAQEERLAKKIDDVHVDVKEARDQARKTNGRVTTAELNIERLQSDVEGMKPISGTVKVINYITKQPKTALFFLVSLIAGIQVFISEAIKHNWIKEVIDYFKP